jgi:hypothetical protein
LYKHHTEKDKVYYCFARPDSKIIEKFINNDGSFNNNYAKLEVNPKTYTREFIVVPVNEIISEFLYNKAVDANYAKGEVNKDSFTK